MEKQKKDTVYLAWKTRYNIVYCTEVGKMCVLVKGGNLWLIRWLINGVEQQVKKDKCASELKEVALPISTSLALPVSNKTLYYRHQWQNHSSTAHTQCNVELQVNNAKQNELLQDFVINYPPFNLAGLVQDSHVMWFTPRRGSPVPTVDRMASITSLQDQGRSKFCILSLWSKKFLLLFVLLPLKGPDELLLSFSLSWFSKSMLRDLQTKEYM